MKHFGIVEWIIVLLTLILIVWIWDDQIVRVVQWFISGLLGRKGI